MHRRACLKMRSSIVASYPLIVNVGPELLQPEVANGGAADDGNQEDAKPEVIECARRFLDDGPHVGNGGGAAKR